MVNSVDGVVDSDTIDLTTQCNINKPSQSNGAIGASKSVNLAKRVNNDQKLPNTDMRPKNPALGSVRPKERTLPKLQYDPAKVFVQQIDTNQGNEPKIQSQIKLPKLELAKFSGEPLEWPEWSSLFLETVDKAAIDDSLKMNHLKTLVSGKAKAAIAGMGYTGQMYAVAWNTLERHFGRSQIFVNAQLKQIYTYPFIKPHDSAQIIKYSQLVSSCVNVLTAYNFVGVLSQF